MKHIAHVFSRTIVEQFLESQKGRASGNFEIMAALLMQRVLEEEWGVSTTIGYYLSEKYTNILNKLEKPAESVLVEALKEGIDQNNPIDFLIHAEDGSGLQEFQLKRFGLGEVVTTQTVLKYLNKIASKYSPIEATCLIAMTQLAGVDFPQIRKAIQDTGFPFSELTFLTVVKDRDLVLVSVFPGTGFSVYPLSTIV